MGALHAHCNQMQKMKASAEIREGGGKIKWGRAQRREGLRWQGDSEVSGAIAGVISCCDCMGLQHGELARSRRCYRRERGGRSPHQTLGAAFAVCSPRASFGEVARLAAASRVRSDRASQRTRRPRERLPVKSLVDTSLAAAESLRRRQLRRHPRVRAAREPIPVRPPVDERLLAAMPGWEAAGWRVDEARSAACSPGW